MTRLEMDRQTAIVPPLFTQQKAIRVRDIDRKAIVKASFLALRFRSHTSHQLRGGGDVLGM
jgi:hypothetical protein